METRNILLPKGLVLEIQMTPQFGDRVRQQFNIPPSAPIDDDHVRMFIFGALSNAVDRVEVSNR